MAHQLKEDLRNGYAFLLGSTIGKKMLMAVALNLDQYMLIDIIAFGIAIFWSAKFETVVGQNVDHMEIWTYVLGNR